MELTDKQKSIICERIGVGPCNTLIIIMFISSFLSQLVDKRLSDGADEYLQMMDLCSVIMTQFCQADT